MGPSGLPSHIHLHRPYSSYQRIVTITRRISYDDTPGQEPNYSSGAAISPALPQIQASRHPPLGIAILRAVSAKRITIDGFLDEFRRRHEQMTDRPSAATTGRNSLRTSHAIASRVSACSLDYSGVPAGAGVNSCSLGGTNGWRIAEIRSRNESAVAKCGVRE